MKLFKVELHGVKNDDVVLISRGWSMIKRWTFLRKFTYVEKAKIYMHFTPKLPIGSLIYLNEDKPVEDINLQPSDIFVKVAHGIFVRVINTIEYNEVI